MHTHDLQQHAFISALVARRHTCYCPTNLGCAPVLVVSVPDATRCTSSLRARRPTAALGVIRSRMTVLWAQSLDSASSACVFANDRGLELLLVTQSSMHVPLAGVTDS
jgi:hypothetical protein